MKYSQDHFSSAAMPLLLAVCLPFLTLTLNPWHISWTCRWASPCFPGNPPVNQGRDKGFPVYLPVMSFPAALKLRPGPFSTPIPPSPVKDPLLGAEESPAASSQLQGQRPHPVTLPKGKKASAQGTRSNYTGGGAGGWQLHCQACSCWKTPSMNPSFQ